MLVVGPAKERNHPGESASRQQRVKDSHLGGREVNVRAYVAARFAIGVPIIPVGRGLFPNHAWAVDLLGLLGVPTVVQRTALFPLTIACGIGTELINAAAEHATGAMATVVAAAAAVGSVRKLRK